MEVLNVNIGEICLALTPTGSPNPGDGTPFTGRDLLTRGERRTLDDKVDKPRKNNRQGVGRGVTASASFTDAGLICEVC